MDANRFLIVGPLFLMIAIAVLISGIFIIHFNNQTSNLALELIDEDGPRSAWGKSAGDMDGDGDIDILVGGHQARIPELFTRVLVKLGLADLSSLGGELFWYENPNWERHLISGNFRIRTDLEVGDIDGDGLNDVVALTDQGTVVFYAPNWKSEIIDSSVMHDIELSDLDRDGDLDLVLRNQTLFDNAVENEIVIFWHIALSEWKEQKIAVQPGEGLKVADINSDDFPDIVVNKDVFTNPVGLHDKAWERIEYTGQWEWQHVFIDVSDINEDGALDILLSPAEPVGSSYRISWFQNPANSGGEWLEHIVDKKVESAHHFIGAGDYDGDGDTDIFSSEMNQGEGDNEVKVYLNDGSHQHWEKVTLGSDGSHSMVVADLDGDFDAEIVGANWHIKDYDGKYAVSLWDYQPEKKKNLWRRHEVGTSSSWKSLFVISDQIDSDGLPDIAAGRFWYKNPGHIGGLWHRRQFGEGLNNVALLKDFDDDGHLDVFASLWRGRFDEPGLLERFKHKVMGLGYPGNLPSNQFSWGRNDGTGKFEVSENMARAEGDFLQGVAQIEIAGNNNVVLSFHKEGYGIQALQIEGKAINESWPWRKLSDISQDEEISIADINQDGLDDMVLGTIWLNQAANWAANTISNDISKPDRNRVADFNHDGWPDILIGEEAVDGLGQVIWFENPGKKPQKWVSHIVGVFYGPMSLDVSDIDDDKDLDIVVGEHRLVDSDKARLILLKNKDGIGIRWQPTLIHVGDEHHNGAQIVDLDKDGDKDIVSIGWGHSRIMVYENLKSVSSGITSQAFE